MKKAKKIIVRLLILFIIIGGGIGSFYIVGFLNDGEIEESYSFYYKPAIRAEPEKLIIISSTGKINIKYNTSSVPYYIKADVNLKAEGIYMKDSDYDYFITHWDNYSSESITELFVSSIGRTLGGFYHPSWTAKYDINIIITLRTDILYDLHFDVRDTEIFISENLSINKLFLETYSSKIELNANGTNINNIEAIAYAGSLTLNLAYCNISDSINVTSTTADINFASYNTKCSKNVEWALRSEKGSINAKIYQSEELGANISGVLLTSMGIINIEYTDSLATVGALFNASAFTGSFVTTNLGGFEALSNNIFRSIDYHSANNIFTFSLINNDGYIEVVGQSS
jgi:hypothetical protein